MRPYPFATAGLVSGLVLLSPHANAAANCDADFVANPPVCIDEDQAIAQCVYEMQHADVDNPAVTSLAVTIETGNGPHDGTVGPVWVRLDGGTRIYLDHGHVGGVDDFARGRTQVFDLAMAGVERYDDIEIFEIGNDGSDHLGFVGAALRVNGHEVFHTHPDFYKAIGGGNAWWRSRADMELDDQAGDVHWLPHDLDARGAIETALGDFMLQELDGALQWKTKGTVWAEQRLMLDFEGDAFGTVFGELEGWLGGETYFSVYLEADLTFECLDGSIAVWADDVALVGEDGIPAAGNTRAVYDLFAAQMEDELEGLLDSLRFGTTDIYDELAAVTGIPTGDPALDEALLDGTCRSLFALNEGTLALSHSFELGDLHAQGEVPEPIVCEEPEPSPPPPPEVPEPELDLPDFDPVFPPNLRVASITTGPDDTMRVTVVNDGGDASHGTYLDIFVGVQLDAPEIGDWGNSYDSFGALAAGETITFSYPRPAPMTPVTAIVDTDEVVLESNEGDNITTATIPFTW